MPKKRKDDDSSDTSLNSSDEESKKSAKKTKVDNSSKSKSSSSSKSKSDPDSIESWEIGNKRVVKIRNFKNRLYVDIREYYLDKDGDTKPGKKGISLSVEQWKKLYGLASEINKTVDEN